MVACVHSFGSWETKRVRSFKKPKGRGAKRCLVSVCGTAAPQPAQEKQITLPFPAVSLGSSHSDLPVSQAHTKAHPNVLYKNYTGKEKKR